MSDGLSYTADIEANSRKFVSEVDKAADSTTKLDTAVKAASVDIQKLQSQYNSFKTKPLFASDAGAVNRQFPLLQQQIQQTIQAEKELNTNLASTRYALYDVATTWGAVSAATLGAAVAVEAVGIKYEAAFASVERTSGAVGDELAQLRSDLIGISTTIPVAFGDVTSIATLGAQLGIASENLDQFTENVAQFGATTDVTVEAAATGFGRLAQLTGAGQDEFDKIGSAIYEVGVNSVATESQILKVSQEIATAGDLAGFSTAEIIGLAGALASLGVQPERARGNILRIFNELNVAVAEGGENLNQFAALANQSASDFANSWQNTPQQAFSDLINGLHAAAEGGAALDIVIKDLGITAVRDVQTLQQLANNTEVYAATQADASRAYAEGTALADGYGIVAETTAAKLQVLANTVLAVADAASELGVVKEVVDFLQNLANVLLDIVNNPVGEKIAAVALTIGALVGVLAAAAAASALFRASIYAMITAQQGLAKSMGTTNLGFKQMAAQMISLSGLARGATGATLTLGTALKGLASSTAIGLGITAAIAGISAVVSEVSKHFESASDKAERLFGDLDGLAQAMRADTEAGTQLANNYRVISVNIESSTTALSDWAQNLQTAAGTQVALNDGTVTTTAGIQRQTIAIGANSAAWLANSLANNEALQSFYQENQTLLQQLGFNLQDFFNAALTSSDGATQYLQQFYDAVNQATAASIAGAQGSGEYGQALNDIIINADGTTAKLDELRNIAEGVDAAFSTQTATALFQNEVFDAATGVINNTGTAESDLADEISNTTSKLQDQVDALFGAENGTVNLQNALYALGGSLQENGNSFDIYSDSGRKNFAALQAVISAAVKASGDDAVALATNLQGIMQALGSFGVNVANQVPSLLKLVNNLTGGKSTGLTGVGQAAAKAGSALGGGYSAGAAKAAKSTKKAQTEVRTLTDYVNDLSSVFNNAFDIRFGYDQSVDAVSEALDALQKNATDAQKAVTDAFKALADSQDDIDDLQQSIVKLDATISGLKADRSILQYQLGIAIEYGDTLRAEAILADLAKTNADLAGAELDRQQTVGDLSDAQNEYTALTKALSDAQTALKRTLDGNSQSARDQRTAVLALVQAYQAQIVALANSGASQDVIRAKTAELQAQFESQMRQLGYNTAETQRYSAAFNDLTYIINNLPRNITVGANLDPAQRALAEYLAQVNRSSANVNVGPSAGTGAALGRDAGAAYADGWNESVNARRRLIVQEAKDLPGGKRYSVDGGRTWFLRKGGQVGGAEYHSVGGVHGMHPGSPKGSDTTPAWLTPGEYVQRTAAVDYYGLPFMNALNNLQVPRYLASGSGPVANASGVGIMMVEFSPTDRALIAASNNITVTIDGKVIANAVNSSNTQNARRGGN